MQDKTVTICIVNYKTLDLTRLCLRSIRKYTKYPYKVMVIDNDSCDESTEYIKSLDWIDFIERKEKTNDYSGGYAHAAALDLGLAKCDTEYFMSMHSDTFVRKQNWLENMMAHFQEDKSVVCVGAGKCEISSTWREVIKRATDFKTFKRKLLSTPDPLGVHRYYNRTVCSIYKTDVLKRENLTFLLDRDKGFTAGRKIYFELVDRGFKTVELSDSLMMKYLWHLAHATQVLNKDEFNIRGRTLRKITKIIKKIWSSKQVQEIIKDDSLDK